MAGSSAELVLTIIRELSSNISAAKKVPFSADSCVINRDAMLDQLERLSKAMPSAIPLAVEYANSIEQIKSETDQACAVKIRDAQAEAERIVSEAQKRAEHLFQQTEQGVQERLRVSQEQSRNMVEGARHEASRIIDEAKRRADQLLHQEEIVKRAQVTAAELNANATAEAEDMRTKTYEYLDELLGVADDKLAELLQEIRVERAELNKLRNG